MCPVQSPHVTLTVQKSTPWPGRQMSRRERKESFFSGLEYGFVGSPCGILTQAVLRSKRPLALDLSLRSFPVVLQDGFGAGNPGEPIQSL